MELVYYFLLFTIQTAKFYGSENRDLFKEWGRGIRDRGCDHCSESWLVQQISIVIQRGGSAEMRMLPAQWELHWSRCRNFITKFIIIYKITVNISNLNRL